MIKAPMKKVKARFPDYEDMEFERRGDGPMWPIT